MIIHKFWVSVELHSVITEYSKEFMALVDPDHKVLQTLISFEVAGSYVR